MNKPIFSLKNVNKSFGSIDVLNDISLEVHSGEVMCLLGDNGAGKYMLIKIISVFLLHPQAPLKRMANPCPSTARVMPAHPT